MKETLDDNRLVTLIYIADIGNLCGKRKTLVHYKMLVDTIYMGSKI